MGIEFIVWGWKAETLPGRFSRIREYTGMGLFRQYHALICPLQSQNPKNLTALKIHICVSTFLVSNVLCFKIAELSKVVEIRGGKKEIYF